MSDFKTLIHHPGKYVVVSIKTSEIKQRSGQGYIWGHGSGSENPNDVLTDGEYL